jgi:hypothetical protein
VTETHLPSGPSRDYAREFTVDGHMQSVRQIKARGDFEEAISAALQESSRER